MPLKNINLRILLNFYQYLSYFNKILFFTLNIIDNIFILNIIEWVFN